MFSARFLLLFSSKAAGWCLHQTGDKHSIICLDACIQADFGMISYRALDRAAAFSFLQKKETSEEISLAMRRLRVLRVILLTTYVPEVRFHGLFASGGVALSEERCLVGTDLHQVLGAQAHCCSYLREARASGELFRLRLGRALHLAADIHAVTGIARGGRYAVRAQEHFLTVVMTGFGRFGECSGYAVDTGTPIDFCHKFIYDLFIYHLVIYLFIGPFGKILFVVRG